MVSVGLMPLRIVARPRRVSHHGRIDRRSHATTSNPMVGRFAPVAHRCGGVAVTCLVGVLLAACSSDASPGVASSSVPAVSDETSPAPTSTTVAATSSSSTSSTSTSTTTTTTTAPTTTIDPLAGAESVVRAAIATAQETFSACLVAMPTCDPLTLAVARAGPILDRNVARINEWNAAGYTVRDRQLFRFVVESVTVDPSSSAASAVVCIADGSKLVQPGAGPGGADVIVDGVYVSGRSVWEMRLDADGRWRVYDAPASGQTESSDVCPAG